MRRCFCPRQEEGETKNSSLSSSRFTSLSFSFSEANAAFSEASLDCCADRAEQRCSIACLCAVVVRREKERKREGREFF